MVGMVLCMYAPVVCYILGTPSVISPVGELIEISVVGAPKQTTIDSGYVFCQSEIATSFCTMFYILTHVRLGYIVSASDFSVCAVFIQSAKVATELL